MKKSLPLLMFAIGLMPLILPSLAMAQSADTGNAVQRSADTHGPDRASGPKQPVPAFTPTQSADVILGCPTATSITLSVLRYDRDGTIVIAYGPQKHHVADQAATQTVSASLSRGEARNVVLEKLRPDTSYAYQVRDLSTSNTLLDGRFHTQRPAGSSFKFTVTADSHLDDNTDLALYQRTLANALAEAPDFHIDLGDTFMTDRHESRENAARQYLAQRVYFGQISHSIPLFLVLGNHDGESGKSRREGANSLAVWSNAMRQRYFPNPAPDGFYSGNGKADPWAGHLHDYYAWTWGDAQFIALNPYWHTDGRRGDERWDLSLGEEQYQWLKRTLEASKARFKIVLVHQLIGGLDRQGRGGTEAAAFGEWGGKNADGSEGFADHRPGWDTPVHSLLVRNGVSLVLHGHDHLFAKQELDGIVYQEVPQPGHRGQGLPRSAPEYGYRAGIVLGGSGHLSFSVSPDKIVADFVRVEASNSSSKRRPFRLVHEIAVSGTTID